MKRRGRVVYSTLAARVLQTLWIYLASEIRITAARAGCESGFLLEGHIRAPFKLSN
jgi:hypothetical protein